MEINIIFIFVAIWFLFTFDQFEIKLIFWFLSLGTCI